MEHNSDMDGIYVFWYCFKHGDGIVIRYTMPNKPIHICDTYESTFLNIPDWVNICEVKNKNEDHNNYMCVGIIQFYNNEIFVIKSVKTNYERENDGFQFKYYLDNIYDFDTKENIDNISNNILYDWFDSFSDNE